MKPNRQDIFNQYRENTIIEVVQAFAKSNAGSWIAFKGGTALKLFYGLPRYSEDVDYDCLPGIRPQEVMDSIKNVCLKKKWDITDEAIKYYTILLELRFPGAERNFHIKAKISTREKKVETDVLSLRGVPVLTLEPSFLMTEKIITFTERQAGRDFFDAWYILQSAYPLHDSMIKRSFGKDENLYLSILASLENADPKKILRDTGKLLGPDHRNWIKTSFLFDFKKLVRNKISLLTLKKDKKRVDPVDAG